MSPRDKILGRRARFVAAALASAGLGTSCSDGPTNPAPTVVDGGADTGVKDGTVMDTGVDTGMPVPCLTDMGPPDTGSFDTGAPDTGPVPCLDSPIVDSGVVDTGVVDTATDDATDPDADAEPTPCLKFAPDTSGGD